MTRLFTTTSTLLLASLAAAVVARQCQNLTFPVSITARNGKFDLKAPSNNIEVTNFILDLTQPGRNLSDILLQDYVTINGTFSMGATYCEPDTGPGKALQVLTHGVGFDRGYWDFPYHDYNYSYVSAALAANYSTFAYDRLGIGQSSAPSREPIAEIQPWLEIASLHALTLQLRAAALPGIARYAKIFHVGHSFGSRLTYNLAATYPEVGAVSDGIALTGFSHVSFLNVGGAPLGLEGPYFAMGANFAGARSLLPRFAAYPDGYVALADRQALHNDFFAPGNFDPEILAPAFEATQPITVGELLTLNNPGNVNSTFGGPVLLITGGTSTLCYCLPHA
ncbi:hypothetical protein SLS62_009059 [Diatrype stigma]|uniref:AB hydrolase-1 domain-containing protein n=1 Tax=Diatrype stigma TaxID=117547 RepID=A0AAN9YKM2_9PEZI